MKLYKSSLLGILAAGLLCGCTDRFDEMNTNPGTVTEANLKYILPTVQELACHNLPTTCMHRSIASILQI